MANIIIFGDSITEGLYDKEKGGWANRLKIFLEEENYNFNLYNLGISGDSTNEVIERFDKEMKARISDDQIIIIFAIGINDSQLVNQSPRYSLESFKENLKKLLEKSKKLTNKIVFIGLTPIDEQKVNPMPWAPGKSYMTDNLNKFDNALKILCQENRLCFIDINKKLTDLNYKELLEDGAHPNSEGHQKMFEIIKSSLLKNNIIAKT